MHKRQIGADWAVVACNRCWHVWKLGPRWEVIRGHPKYAVMPAAIHENQVHGLLAELDSSTQQFT